MNNKKKIINEVAMVTYNYINHRFLGPQGILIQLE